MESQWSQHEAVNDDDVAGPLHAHVAVDDRIKDKEGERDDGAEGQDLKRTEKRCLKGDRRYLGTRLMKMYESKVPEPDTKHHLRKY